MGAVFLLKDNPIEYASIVKESVVASQKLMHQNSSKLSSKFSRNKSSNKVSNLKLYSVTGDDNESDYFVREYVKLQEKNKALKNISFEEYINLWRGIATTKANAHEENVYLKSNVFDNPAVLFQHLSISLKDLEREV